jgi:hypothetical protein
MEWYSIRLVCIEVDLAETEFLRLCGFGKFVSVRMNSMILDKVGTAAIALAVLAKSQERIRHAYSARAISGTLSYLSQSSGIWEVPIETSCFKTQEAVAL